jgi:GT2 family glycosyltransferase
MLAHNRRPSVETGLRHLEDAPVDEIIVVDNASTDGTEEMVREWGGKVRLVRAPENVGVAGRNLGAREASGDFLLLIDDDSYPLPGAVQALLEAIRAHPKVAVVGGLIRDRNPAGQRIPDGAVGTFDWWLRCGQEGDPPPEGFRSIYFPECGCLIRREAYFDAGGFFEPYFFHISEPDFAIRMLARGWDVRYLPTAEFEHAKQARDRSYIRWNLRHRVRNELWFFWLRFPARVAARRIPAYAVLFLLECVYQRSPSAWFGGIAEAWRKRDQVRPYRDPIPRDLVSRAELGRSRMQVRFAAWMLWHRALPRLLGRRKPGPAGD